MFIFHSKLKSCIMSFDVLTPSYSSVIVSLRAVYLCNWSISLSFLLRILISISMSSLIFVHDFILWMLFYFDKFSSSFFFSKGCGDIKQRFFLSFLRNNFPTRESDVKLTLNRLLIKRSRPLKHSNILLSRFCRLCYVFKPCK